MPSENVIIGIAQRVPNVVIFKSIDKELIGQLEKDLIVVTVSFFLNEKLGWAIGGKVGAGLIGYQQKSFIYITLDGGETWDLIFDSLFYKDCIGFLFNINFKNSNEGIAVGSTGTILLTFDGWKIWHLGTSDSIICSNVQTFNSVKFTENGNAVTVNGSNEIFVIKHLLEK